MEVTKNGHPRITRRVDINKCEGVVWRYFLEKGFNIVMGKMLSDNKGIPDFFVSKGDKHFWVEVKSDNDGVRPSQIEWAATYGDYVIIVAVVNFRYDDNASKPYIEFYKLDMRKTQLKEDEWLI